MAKAKTDETDSEIAAAVRKFPSSGPIKVEGLGLVGTIDQPGPGKGSHYPRVRVHCVSQSDDE